jgi:hypothetical protein
MRRLLLAGVAALIPVLAHAQAQFPTNNPNAKVFGAVAFCIDANGVAQPILACSGYANLNANGTTTLKSGKGFLSKVTINTKGASANTLTLYDNTTGSGTKIATIDTTAGGTLPYDIEFSTGLTAVLATGTAADVTISFK